MEEGITEHRCAAKHNSNRRGKTLSSPKQPPSLLPMGNTAAAPVAPVAAVPVVRQPRRPLAAATAPTLPEVENQEEFSSTEVTTPTASVDKKSRRSVRQRTRPQRDPTTGRYLPRRQASPAASVGAVRRRVAVEVVPPAAVHGMRASAPLKVAAPVRAASPKVAPRAASPQRQVALRAASPKVAAPRAASPGRRALASSQRVEAPLQSVTFVDQQGEPQPRRRGRRAASPASTEQTARGAPILRSSYCRTDAQWTDAAAEQQEAAAVTAPPRSRSRKPRAQSVETTAVSRRDYATPSLTTPGLSAASPRKPRKTAVKTDEQHQVIAPSTVRRVRRMAATEQQCVTAAPEVEKLSAPAAPNSADVLWRYMNAP